MASLQSALEQHLSELPRYIVTELVRDKLKAIGRSDHEQFVRPIVDQLLERALKGSSEQNDPDGHIESEQEFVLNFTSSDADRLTKFADEIGKELPDLVQTIAEKLSRQMLASYQRDWAKWHNATTVEIDQFRANLEERWGKGFNYLRMLIELSRDIGTDFLRRTRRSRSAHRIHLNRALYLLHVRALQISSEMMTLMENGFADGAMARWRTLHEVTCVAMVLNDGGDALAERYIAHEIVEAKKGLLQYERCHAWLGYSPFPKREVAHIKRQYTAAIDRYGEEFGGDYGWAAAYLNSARPNFSQIEIAAGKEMMRSHYKMASQNVHATTKGISYRLGSIDPTIQAIAGPSNVGFVEPGQNLALSLLHITTLLFPKRWNLDRIVQVRALTLLQERVPRALAKSERAIVRDEQRLQVEAASRRSKRQRRKANRR